MNARTMRGLTVRPTGSMWSTRHCLVSTVGGDGSDLVVGGDRVAKQSRDVAEFDKFGWTRVGGAAAGSTAGEVMARRWAAPRHPAWEVR